MKSLISIWKLTIGLAAVMGATALISCGREVTSPEPLVFQGGDRIANTWGNSEGSQLEECPEGSVGEYPYCETDPCYMNPGGPGCADYCYYSPSDPNCWQPNPPCEVDCGGGGSVGDAFSDVEEALGGCKELAGTDTPPGGGGTWSPTAFATYLKANAQPKSTGACARYVRKALCHGGGITGACDAYKRPECAKDYGPYLVLLGFSAVATGTGTSASGYPAGYTPATGDVVVVNYTPNGHVAGYDGTNWTSDWVQADIQPTMSIPNRTYTIYRRAP